MAVWEVRDHARSVEVDAPNWMMAIGTAMEQLGRDGTELACMVCDIQPDGVVRIYDPKADMALLVRRMPEPAAAAPAPATAADLAVAEDLSEEVPAPPPAVAADPTDLPAPAFGVDPTDAPAAPAAVLPVSDPAPDPAPSLTGPGVARVPEGVIAVGPEGAAEDDAGDEAGDTLADEAADEAPRAAASPLRDLADELAAAHVPPPPPAIAMSATPSGMFDDLSIDEPSAGFDAEDLDFVSSVRALPQEAAPDDLAELLFEGGMDIAGADSPTEAAEAALSLLGRFVPVESSAVLVAGINDAALHFLSVTGPSAEEVRHLTVPFNKGFAGFCHTMGADLIVRDAEFDPRLYGEVDAQSGYRTRAILAAALRDADGDVHGCIELLNPSADFQHWHLEAARAVAHTLANYLGTRV